MTDEKKKSPYDILKESPMFQLSLASKELFHSNFLAWIGSWEGDKGPEHPFRQLMNKLGASHAVERDLWGKDWYVAREYKNFDLCVLDSIPEDFESEDSDDSEENGKKQPHVLLVLENKVKSIPNIEQLHEYQDKIIDINFDWIKNPDLNNLKYKWQFNEKEAQKHKDQIKDDPDNYVANNKKTAIVFLKNKKTDFLLLSMSETFPDRGIVDGERIWCYNSYSKYSQSLDDLCNGLKLSLSKCIINDYNLQLKSLLELHKDWTLDDDFLKKSFLYYEKKNDEGRIYRFDYPLLKRLRIHDLFQKQRYAKMCSILKEKIETNIIKNSNLECVSRLDLAKDSLENKVFVGFNFLHGEPLLDIWLGTEDFVYTIQIQGDSYEHGIQKKLDGGKNKGENSKKLWNLIWDEENAIAKSVNGWNWICPFKDDLFGEDGKIISEDNGKNYFPIIHNSIFDSIFENQCIYPQNPRKRDFPFLKYEMDTGVTFIYQYRKISDSASVDAVLDYIVADLKSLCNIVLKSND